MLEKFISITEAITLPDLQEYNWRSDKVSIHPRNNHMQKQKMQ